MGDDAAPPQAKDSRHAEFVEEIGEFLETAGAPELTLQERQHLAQMLLEIERYLNLLYESAFARELRSGVRDLEKVVTSARRFRAPHPDVFGREREAAIAGLEAASAYLELLSSGERRLSGKKRSGPVIKGAIQIRLGLIVGVFGRAVQREHWHKSAAWHAHFLLDHLNASRELSLPVPSEKTLLNYLSTYRVLFQQKKFVRDGEFIHFTPAGSTRTARAGRTPFDPSIRASWREYFAPLR